MSKLIKKNTNFKKRIFSQSEIRQCNANTNKYACYSKRFAAKEAFSKALGTGISNGLNFNNEANNSNTYISNGIRVYK